MKEGGLFWPVFLILVGSVILLVNLGVLPAETWRYWPLVLIVPGLLKLSGLIESSEEKKK